MMRWWRKKKNIIITYTIHPIDEKTRTKTNNIISINKEGFFFLIEDYYYRCYSLFSSAIGHYILLHYNVI